MRTEKQKALFGKTPNRASNNSPGRIRTADKVVNSHLLYQLSYGRLWCKKIAGKALQRNEG